MRALDLDPVHDTRKTFRSLCDAMSRPGTVQRTPVTPADHAVMATLVDHEVTTHTNDDTLRAALSDEGRFEAAASDEADVVHTHGVPAWDVTELGRGSLVEPSDGATLVYRTDALSSTATDTLSAVSLSGPGVPGERTVHLDVPADELDALAATQSGYPRGVDAIFTADDQIAAIPRSVTMEVA